VIKESTNHDEISEAMIIGGESEFIKVDGWRYFIAYRGDKVVGALSAQYLWHGVWIGHMSLGPDSGGMASRYARQAARLLLDTGAKRVLGVINSNNPRSLRAALGAGFRYISKVDGQHITEFCQG
jgi:RimJ/RimL family protein N-acetyltransferase